MGGLEVDLAATRPRSRDSVRNGELRREAGLELATGSPVPCPQANECEVSSQKSSGLRKSRTPSPAGAAAACFFAANLPVNRMSVSLRYLCDVDLEAALFAESAAELGPGSVASASAAVAAASAPGSGYVPLRVVGPAVGAFPWRVLAGLPPIATRPR